MEQESVLDYKKLEVRRVKDPGEEIINLLKSTMLGSEGGMRYSMQNTEERIKAYGNGLSFLALYKKQSLVGVIGLCRRVTSNLKHKYNSTHLRYLCVQSTFQTSRAPGRNKEKQAQVKESFKQKIISVITNPRQAYGSEDGPVSPHVMYAYVESHNERSRNLINQSGYEYIRSFLTVAFSRFNPRKDPAVSKLRPEEEPDMAHLLEDYYSNYCFYTDEFSFYEHRYYVMRKDGRVVAGVGAIPSQFRIANIPGVWGWLMMRVLSRLPYFRRLFRPEKFRYLILTGIYCIKGYEKFLPDLFEAVCAEEGYNTALTWLDDHSDLFEKLRTNRYMGTINRLLNAKPGLVYASFSGLSPEETEKFYESPAYISGFDFS